MSLFAELRRRKVFKVGAAYLVVAWIVIQVGATVAPQLGLPDWAPRMITLIVLLGMPVALVVAWLVEVTPEGLKVETAPKGNKRVFTIAAILIAVALGWFLGSGKPGRLAGISSSAEMGDNSTAVLPFVNMSSDKDNEYFSDGLTETLLHKLAQVPEIKVAARTSSFAFKGKNLDIREIGEQLGVATVLEGSVQRAGPTLRITAQLVRTADGSHIWSRSYDRKTTDLFAIQDEIASAVTQALVGALVPATEAAIKKGGSSNLAAYDDYIRGLHEAQKNTYGALTAAEALMQSAIKKDPEYVDALLGLVQVWFGMEDTGLISSEQFISRSAPILDRVDGLDPGNGLLLGMRSKHAQIRGESAAEAKLLERAIAASPGNANLYSMYADYLLGERNSENALTQLDKAIQLDPLNANFYRSRANYLMQLQRFEEAERAALKSLELNPNDSNPLITMAELADLRGDLAGSIVWHRKAARTDPSDHEIPEQLALQLDDIGEPAAADAWVAESRRLRPGNLVADSAEVMLRFNRGQHEAVLAGALAMADRHSEERRSNWVSAMAVACLSARQLGRVAELRSALDRAHALPMPLSAEGIKALATPTLSVQHQISHIGPLWACLVDPGAAGNVQREHLLAVVTALEKPGWQQRPEREGLAAFLQNDKEKLIALSLPPKRRNIDNLVFREARARYVGIADDPRIQARIAEIRSQLKLQHAKLPQLLAAEGLTVLPANATR